MFGTIIGSPLTFKGETKAPDPPRGLKPRLTEIESICLAQEPAGQSNKLLIVRLGFDSPAIRFLLL